ncbi:hypothetical protein OG496_42415 [Streptomyces sp. NBC_00988]|uniref:hypothetical protein n=1 Tax=Streptomyces sp. NBC_00988 TaxID=2903704 RepID=UPI003865A315|nr:hypothetical protein OG496_42415 [Streptomyces sp. NBC_00988]
MDREALELERWRVALMSELGSPDVGVSTRALLAMTWDDPDRERVEGVLLDCLSPDTDPQIRALAVTCMGHVGRIHRAVSVVVVRRLEQLVDDPALGGVAEDALGDIANFAGEGLK